MIDKVKKDQKELNRQKNQQLISALENELNDAQTSTRSHRSVNTRKMITPQNQQYLKIKDSDRSEYDDEIQPSVKRSEIST